MGLPLNLTSNPKLRKNHPEGSVVTVVQPARHPQYGSFSLVVPHHLNFSLCIAQKNLKESQDIFQEILKKSSKGESNIWLIKNDKIYLDFFSHLSTAVIFSCNAIEIHSINGSKIKRYYGSETRWKITAFSYGFTYSSYWYLFTKNIRNKIY